MRPHRKLIAWQEAIQFVKEIYQLTKLLPNEEKFGITSQLRRAAISVPLNLAEGAARQSDKEFIKFLFISEGSLSEIDTILEICRELDYFSEQKLQSLFNHNAKISAIIRGLRESIMRRSTKPVFT